jgi:hypothetical protein
VAGQLGYCGLDRQRRPLRGDEIRPCWEAADATGTTVPALPGVGPVWPLEPDEDRTAVRSLQFVEVQPEGRSGPAEPSGDATDTPTDPMFLTASTGGEPRWSLWGEAEA